MGNANNDNYLFDLIQNIQSKMNNESSNSVASEDTNTNTNTNTNTDTVTNNNTNGFNFSNLFDMLNNNTSNSDSNSNLQTENSNFDINNLFSMFNNTENNSNTDENINFNKIQNILSTLTKKDPRKELLIALKPFLRKSRQDKINEYLMYLTIASSLGIFNKNDNKEDFNE